MNFNRPLDTLQQKVGQQYLGLLGDYANSVLLGKVVIALPLLVWMAISLANVSLRLMPQPPLNAVDMTDSDRAFAPVKPAQLPQVDIKALKSIELFGKESPPEPVVAEEKPEPVQEKIEETRLNLELVGSFVSDQQDQASAIISKGQKQGLYRVNEEIADLNSVKLIQVFADRVVIDNRGRQEALYMYPQGKSIVSGKLVSSELSSIRAARVNEASGNLGGVDAKQRLEKISDAIRFSRKTKDGRMQGFRVLPGRNRKAFEQTGLQLNDVVTAIDGQTLDNLRAANKIYQEKRNATQASLTVLRGDEELTVDVDLNNININ